MNDPTEYVLRQTTTYQDGTTEDQRLVLGLSQMVRAFTPDELDALASGMTVVRWKTPLCRKLEVRLERAATQLEMFA